MQFNTHEAKSQLPKLIELALAGEEVIIAEAGKPSVRIVPYQSNVVARKPGSLAGKVKTAEDAFSAETDQAIQAMFDEAAE